MSRYIDINQLLEEIGTSARSAGDPWTLSHTYRGTLRQDAFNPSVVADLSAPVQELTSQIQASQKIEHADAIAASPASSGQSQTSTGSGFFGGVLNAFPLASGIAKLFGFGDKPSPPALTPYEHPPSISFEGAMSSSTSGVTSLSYGANGLPRTAQTATTAEVPNRSEPQYSAGQTSSNIAPQAPLMSNFTGIDDYKEEPLNSGQGGRQQVPAEVSSVLAGQVKEGSSAAPPPSGIPGQFDGNSGSFGLMPAMQNQLSGTSELSPAMTSFATSGTNDTDLVGQLTSLASSTFTPEQSGANSILSANHESWSSFGTSSQNSGNQFPSNADSQGGLVASPSGAGSTGAQGQSILVQVQAMDSQSFMDHSQDIAQAVRQAMLNLNSLNDVILDL